MSEDIKLWSSNSEVVLAKTADVTQVIPLAKQLKSVDQKQILTAYKSGNYKMLSTYVWAKTITTIKSQLMKMGPAFIGEMLDRPDITEYSNLQHYITEFESLQLAEDLGLVSNKSAFRLKQAMDLISYFNNPDLDDEEDDDFSQSDAETVLRTCIQSVLGQERLEFRIDFKQFRKALEEKVFNEDDEEIRKLIRSPYFFKRATVRIILSIIKSSVSAQLENILANANLIIPLTWDDLKQPEKWQIGRLYAELFTDGKSKAVSGLKKLLLKVKGFDFVPEDLRSTAYFKAANEILIAHEGMNNFYNEPSPVFALSNMGSTIPIPAFPICMTAILSVKIGNYYGVSNDAQKPAQKILKTISTDRWLYYFSQCLSVDQRILYKLSQTNTLNRWFAIVKEINEIDFIISNVQNSDIKSLLRYSLSSNTTKVKQIVERINSKNGYSE